MTLRLVPAPDTHTQWLIPNVIRGGAARVVVEGAESPVCMVLYELALSCSSSVPFFGQYTPWFGGPTSVISCSPSVTRDYIDALRAGKDLVPDPERLRFVHARQGGIQKALASVPEDTRMVVLDASEHWNLQLALEMGNALHRRKITVVLGTPPDAVRDWCDQRLRCTYEHLKRILTLSDKRLLAQAVMKKTKTGGIYFDPLPPNLDLAPVDKRIWQTLYKHELGMSFEELLKYLRNVRRDTTTESLATLQRAGLAQTAAVQRGKRRLKTIEVWTASLPEV